MTRLEQAVEELSRGEMPERTALRELITAPECGETRLLTENAARVRREKYGSDVYIRGLIEFTNCCKNDCFYCGIRRSNFNVQRYRLNEEQILDCCRLGYPLGFRTFVLQGGEDLYFTDERLCSVVRAIKNEFPDCAVTLSVGERSRESYALLREAGADRYLLRHETASPAHYASLHPREMSFERRMKCLDDLKSLGFQTGCGFMVGSPFQTPDDLVNDLCFIRDFRPEMVGIGPFIPHRDTPFSQSAAGSVQTTLRLLSILRLLLPTVLLPATTALGTLGADGRERGILAGANVVMPNLSPPNERCKYELYNNKLCDGCEAAQGLEMLKSKMTAIGYAIVTDRGDYKQ